MTARLRLLCHGATSATRASAFSADEPVEDREGARLAAVASRLPRFDVVLSAPSRAAMGTAAALGLEAGAEPALADLDLGRWRGRALAEVFETEPEGAAAWVSDPRATPHGGESIVGLVARVGTLLDAAALQGRVLAITHAAVMRAAIVVVLGAPAEAFWSIDAGPLTAVDVSHDSRRWRLRCQAA